MITNVRLQNFRKHRDYTAEFLPGTVVITGSNGSGKTSIIEAVCIALQGKSWRSNFAEIVRRGEDWWRVDVEFDDGESRTVKFNNGTKEFVVDGQSFSRLPVKYKMPVVLFEPNDLNIIYGSPGNRRNFVDRFISQINSQHAVNLRKFERVLQQRNNLLKQGADHDDLFVWDVQFADLAVEIINFRKRWIEEINKQITNIYDAISNNNDVIGVRYDCDQNTSKQDIMRALNNNENLFYTNIGPQKHDVLFEFNSLPAKTTASRGENRTIIVSVYYAIISLTKKYKGDPILLFDDIFGEIDDDRRNNLSIKGDLQTIITSIDVANDKNFHQISL